MLKLVSFVGVDKNTDLDKLIAIDREYKENHHIIIEWGFLVSFGNTKNRYPSLDFIKESIKYLNDADVKTSVHLCGKEAINGFFSKLTPDVDNPYREQVWSLLGNGRIQLNFNINNYDDINLLAKDIIEISKDESLSENIIIQSNKSKEALISKLLYLENFEDYWLIDILYDASGGFNKQLNDVKPCFKGILTGYAGGINPTNVVNILNMIREVNNDYFNDYYIDMESGIRDINDFLSLEKCIQVLDQVNLFLNEKN